jgi:sugar lactone lactonase YvrE
MFQMVLAAALAQTCGIGATATNEGLHQAFAAAAYSLADAGHGTWRGVNPRQRLTVEFDSREIRLTHPDGSVSFHLSGYGYGDWLQKPVSAKMAANGNRVDYHRGDLIEWYVNGSRGLEQGFTLYRRPAMDHESGPLTIALDVTGGLLAEQRGDDDSVVFESGKGVVLRYAGLMARDARGQVLPSRVEARGHEIMLIVEDRKAQYPLVVDPTWTQQQTLAAPDGTAYGYFGAAVSVSGDTAVVGAWGASDTRGTAYVFVNTAGKWILQQELTASDGAMGDKFGWSVSVNGDTAVIGAWSENNYQGAAYVFVRSLGVWTQQQKLTASGDESVAFFGYSVAVDGNTAVIGAEGSNGGQGTVYVFARSGGAWSQQQELTTSDGAADDAFGLSVSVNGNTAVIGAPGKNDSQGTAYVFLNSGGVWNQQQELMASDGVANDNFGNSVSICGETAVIGAPANGGRGAVYVFVNSAGAWGQQRKLIASDGAPGAHFGSVSVNGDTAVIGAQLQNGGPGVAYMFVRNGGAWTQQQEMAASGSVAFGNAVSVSGATVVIGAQITNTSQGAAYVFVRPILGTNAILVGSAPGSSSVVLSDSGPWTATANNSFLHISPSSASGSGSAVVVFTYDAFTTETGTRTGTLTIAGLTATVTQVGMNYIGPGPEGILVSSGPQATGVAVDGSGNVYIADAFGSAVWEWSPTTQQMTKLVAQGLNFPTGVAVDSAGNLYIADPHNNAIEEWSALTQQVTALVSSGLETPYGVAVDSFGNVYISDTGNSAIKEWNAATQQVTTLVSSGLLQPVGVAVDKAGNVYIADSGNGIGEWNASTQQLTGLKVSLEMSAPTGVAVDGSGNVYIADESFYPIKEYSASTRQTSSLVAPGVNTVYGVAVDGSGDVYAAYYYQGAITEIPYAFVGPFGLTEPASAGSDSLLQVLPPTTSLTGIFAPVSDQSWLTIGTVADGVINFSFTANTSSERTAHVGVLGHGILGTAVAQSAAAAQTQTITFLPPANQIYGEAPFALSASASSGLPVSFNSLTTPVCAVTGTTATLLSTGTCTIQAIQAGNATYAAAPPVIQSCQVNPFACDVTGTDSVADVQLITNEALGAAPAVYDLNRDGAVNVVDVQNVVNAVPQAGCPY